MKVLSKSDLESLIAQFPDGGSVFAGYTPDVLTSELMVTDGDFGAKCIIPQDGEVFDFDWNIGEYRDTDLFAVFDNNDILQMIQTLTSGLKISCKPWWEE